jgi:hypothetical protein
MFIFGPVHSSAGSSGSYVSPDNDHSAMMMVVATMVVVIRLRISGSREEGDESK